MKWKPTSINMRCGADDWSIGTIARVYLHRDQSHWHWSAHPIAGDAKHGFAGSKEEAREAAEAVLKSAGLNVGKSSF